MNIPSYITSQILIVKYFSGQIRPLTCLRLQAYYYILNIFKIFFMNKNSIDDLVFNWIQSLELNCTDKWIMNCLYNKIGLRSSELDDDRFNAYCSTDFQNVRRELRRFVKKKILKVEYDSYKNRTVTILVPKFIKKIAKNYYSTENRSLTFYGNPVEEIATNYDGKIIREVKLLDVYSQDEHIYFKEYWILKEVISESELESELGKVYFKGLPYITKSAHFLIRPFQDQTQPLGASL